MLRTKTCGKQSEKPNTSLVAAGWTVSLHILGDVSKTTLHFSVTSSIQTVVNFVLLPFIPVGVVLLPSACLMFFKSGTEMHIEDKIHHTNKSTHHS